MADLFHLLENLLLTQLSKFLNDFAEKLFSEGSLRPYLLYIWITYPMSYTTA